MLPRRFGDGCEVYVRVQRPLFDARIWVLQGPHASWIGEDVAQRISRGLRPRQRLHDLRVL
jgi:hypothetical protein